MYDRNAAIATAKAQEGYLEKKNGNLKYLYNKTANAGKANYTKFGLEMHKIYPAVMDYPAAWCGAFVDWVFQKTYGVSTAKGILQRNFDDYTVAAAQAYKKKGALNHTPELGAQIFFSRNGQVSGIYHTGLVTKVTNRTVYTIEGNTSSAANVVPNGGAVRSKSYARTSTAISRAFFGHPNYQDGNKDSEAPKAATNTTTTATKTKKQAAQLFARSTAGAYTVNVRAGSILYLRTGASKDYTAIAEMPRGAKVICYGYYNATKTGIWLYVQYGKKTGFCSKAYLTR